jgi:hypothetical protein
VRDSILIILVFFSCGFGKAQTNQLMRTQANEAMMNKDWYAAQQYYQRLYFRDSTNLKIQYRYAEASRLAFDLEVALRLYLKVAEYDNGARYPLTFFWIGEILKHKESYKEAKKWFGKFNKLEFKKEKYAYYRKKVKVQLESCDLAQILLKQPIPVQPYHLDLTVNSKVSEYAPLEFDSVLYFSTMRGLDRKGQKDDERYASDKAPFSKVYRSDIKNEKYKKIKAMDTLINSKVFHSANVTFSPDNSQMIISRCVSKNASEYLCDLHVSVFRNKKWQFPIKLDPPINQPSVSTTQPCFAVYKDKTILFFSSDRPGGEGGMDIWYSVQKSGGYYDEPVNAGKLINTPDDEITPWFQESDSTLYFSSTYHQGLGGFDVFKSVFINYQFNEPVNMGTPINSSYNDLYYTVNKENTRSYLSSNRLGSYFETRLNCCNDIYRFTVIKEEIPEPPKIDSVAVEKEKLKLLVPLTLYFHNDRPDPKTTATVTALSYDSTYKDYMLLKDQYLTEHSQGLKKDELRLAENAVSNFFADSVSSGMDDLKRFEDLLQKVLEKGETVKITMRGYCSPLASTEYNINLAHRRISSLKNYFLRTRNGYFNRYVNNADSTVAKIIFEEVQIGELPASKVSDQLKDKRNSVYSPQAASERKIQIIAVSFGKTED